MASYAPNKELVNWLRYAVNESSPEDLTLKLYQNDVTPDNSTVVGDLTEADFSGYSDETLTPANWNFTEASTAVATYNAAVEFTSDSSQSTQEIYGYYIVGASSGDLKRAEGFPEGPYQVSENGDSVSVTPRITHTNAG